MVVVADSERMRNCMAPDRRREPCDTPSREHRDGITQASRDTPNGWRENVLRGIVAISSDVSAGRPHRYEPAQTRVSADEPVRSDRNATAVSGGAAAPRE